MSAPAAAEEETKKVHRKPYEPRPRVYTVLQKHVNPSMLAGAQRVHSKGFKLLSKASPIERSLTTYFRLAPRAPPRIAAEHAKLQTVVQKAAEQLANRRQVILDGFMVLDATKAPIPSQARECVITNSGLVGAVPEDLSLFVNLSFLDVGENHLALADLAPLLNLEELHLHCNDIEAVSIPIQHPERPEGQDENRREESPNSEDAEGSVVQPFSRLKTLNLSFNRINSDSLIALASLPSLERLDLSYNRLRHLPSNLAAFAGLQQLALEGNGFRTVDVFVALSTMPSLIELNLGKNRITSVPRIAEGGFPALEILGLASNKLEYFEDLYPLTQLRGLKCIVLHDNPIQRRRKDREILDYEFGNLGVQIVVDPSVPPKRAVGAFYVANVAQIVKVRDFKRIIRQRPNRKSTASPPPPEADVGGTFFMTQAQQAGAGPAASGVSLAQPSAAKSAPPPGHQAGGVRTDEALSGEGRNREQSWMVLGESESGMVHDPVSPQRLAARGLGSSLPAQGDYPSTDAPPAHATLPDTAEDYGFLPDIHEPRGTLRSTLTELKRMLRQPLPPLSTARFATRK